MGVPALRTSQSWTSQKYETVASDENKLGELDESGAKKTNVAHDSSTLETHSGAKDIIKSMSDFMK